MTIWKPMPMMSPMATCSMVVTMPSSENGEMGVGGAATVNGGGGSDRLIAALSGDNVWKITAQNTGTLNDVVVFTSVEQLIGGASADRFEFSDGVGVGEHVAAVPARGGRGAEHVVVEPALRITEAGGRRWRVGAVQAPSLFDRCLVVRDCLHAAEFGLDVRLVGGGAAGEHPVADGLGELVRVDVPSGHRRSPPVRVVALVRQNGARGRLSGVVGAAGDAVEQVGQ